MKLDPDSFSTKIILIGIDKLVFTLLLALILGIGAFYQRKLEREVMYAEELNRRAFELQLAREGELHSIKVQRPIELLEELSDLIRHSTLITKRVSEHPLPEEDREKLVSLLLGIDLKLEMIKSYSKDREKADRIAYDLQEIVTDALAKPDVTDNDLKELGETLNRQFANLFERMIGETTKIIKEGKKLEEHRIVLF